MAGTHSIRMSSYADSTRRLTVGQKQAVELAVERFRATVEEGPDKGRSATLSAASLLVGTDPACDLVLTDPTVSRRHAALTLTADGIQVEDLGSTNGTWLGSARLKSIVVGDGARLRIGSTQLALALVSKGLVGYPGNQESFAGLIGRSQAMRELFAIIGQLARTDLPVLVTGETGCGKELVARALHQAGSRAKKPFLVLDCGSIVPDLLRSELFGHEKGAFTGATSMKKGILEEAASGTVVLDEIGELPMSVQPQLLRALEAREITRIGSQAAVPVDFRIVAATNRDLQQFCEEGRFRRDLYFRLACVTVRLPPLRDRREDIPLLADHFVRQCARRHAIEAGELTQDALDQLSTHDWPGNVRELRNVMEAATVLSVGQPITGQHVRQAGSMGAPSASGVFQKPGGAPTPSTLEDAERAVIEKALNAAGWNRRQAARALGISHTTLFDRIRRYGLKPPGGAS